MHLLYRHPNLASGGSGDKGIDSRRTHPRDDIFSSPNCTKGSLETESCFNELPQASFQAPHLYRLLL